MHNSVFTGSLKTGLASFGFTVGKAAARRGRVAIPTLSILFFRLAIFGPGVQEGEARTVRVSVPAASIRIRARPKNSCLRSQEAADRATAK